MLETYPVNYSARERSSSQEFLRFLFRAETAGSYHRLSFWRVAVPNQLRHPGTGDPERELAHTSDHTHALGYANRAARVEQIEDVGTLEHLIRSEERRVGKECRSR